MATVTASPSTKPSSVTPSPLTPAVPETAPRESQAVPKWRHVRMGRAEAVGDGISWPMVLRDGALSRGRHRRALPLQLAAPRRHGWCSTSWPSTWALACAITACSHIAATRSPSGWNMSWPSSLRCRSRAGPCSGCPLIACTTNSATMRATPIPPARADGGRILAGFSLAIPPCSIRVPLPLFSRPGPRPLPRLAEQIPLDSRSPRAPSSCLAWAGSSGGLAEALAWISVGRLPARHARASRHLAGKFCHAHVGQPPL